MLRMGGEKSRHSGEIRLGGPCNNGEKLDVRRASYSVEWRVSTLSVFKHLGGVPFVLLCRVNYADFSSGFTKKRRKSRHIFIARLCRGELARPEGAPVLCCPYFSVRRHLSGIRVAHRGPLCQGVVGVVFSGWRFGLETAAWRTGRVLSGESMLRAPAGVPVPLAALLANGDFDLILA